MSSIFTKIINGEIPAYKVAESESCLAFLDISPLREGHTLVVPKTEVDYLFDLDRNSHATLWEFAREVSHKIRKVIPCERIGVAVIGLEVPHAHIHLIPIDGVGDINFSRPKLQLTQEELSKIAESIRTA